MRGRGSISCAAALIGLLAASCNQESAQRLTVPNDASEATQGHPQLPAEVAHEVPPVPRSSERPTASANAQPASRMAIPFQENDGQWPDDVAFKVDHVGGSLWVTDDGVLVYSLLGARIEADASPAALRGLGATMFEDSSPQALRSQMAAAFGLPSSRVESPGVPERSAGRNVLDDEVGAQPAARSSRSAAWTIAERFVDGHPHTPVGLEPSPTNVSYFTGDDESKWASHVATFGALTLGDVWPGIEVRLARSAKAASLQCADCRDGLQRSVANAR